MALAIPESHQDLLNCPRVAALTTLMPDGQPQTTVVWCNYDGAYVLVNTMRGFQKEKNMRANPKVTLLCYDPHQPLRYLEVRGTVVEMTEEGAMDHLDRLSELYTGRKPYFGECVPADFRGKEIPVLCKILPTYIVALDATCEKQEVVMNRPIPQSHLDLLTRPIHGVLTTVMADGQPQSSLVWCDFDGECACINT